MALYGLLIGTTEVFDGLVSILTLGQYVSDTTFPVSLWLTKRKASQMLAAAGVNA